MPFLTQGKTNRKFLLIIAAVIIILFLIIKSYAFSNNSLTRNECLARNGTMRTQNLNLPDFLRRFFVCKLREINLGHIWDVNCICDCCKALF